MVCRHTGSTCFIATGGVSSNTGEHTFMSTIIQGELVAADFALDETFEALPGLEVEWMHVVANGRGGSWPLICARGPQRDELESALHEDDSIEQFTMLVESENERLYRIEWDAWVNEAFSELLEHNAAILDVYANVHGWTIQLLFPERADVPASDEFFQHTGVTFEIHRIKNVEVKPTNEYGLTTKQRQALITAWRSGYFAIPRKIDLEELADQMGLSHQALSERLRRGHYALIAKTIGNSAPGHAFETLRAIDMELNSNV